MSLHTLAPLLLVLLLLLLLLHWLLPRRQRRLGNHHDILVPLAVLNLVLPPPEWREIMTLNQPLHVRRKLMEAFFASNAALVP